MNIYVKMCAHPTVPGHHVLVPEGRGSWTRQQVRLGYGLSVGSWWLT